MTTQIPALLFGAFALYAMAFAGCFFPKTGKSKSVLTIGGLLLQTMALKNIYVLTNAFPTSTIYGLVEVIAWFCAIIAVFGFIFEIDFLKKATILAAILTILPACCPVFLQKISESKIQSSLLVQIHAIFAALSYVFMFIASAISLVYMRKHSALKKAIMTQSSSSLQTLSKVTKILLLVATCAMAVSIILGIVAMRSSGVNAMMFAKIVAGICVLTIQIYISGNIVLQNIKGSPLAKLSTTLLIVSIVALIPITLRSIM